MAAAVATATSVASCPGLGPCVRSLSSLTGPLQGGGCARVTDGDPGPGSPAVPTQLGPELSSEAASTPRVRSRLHPQRARVREAASIPNARARSRLRPDARAWSRLHPNTCACNASPAERTGTSGVWGAGSMGGGSIGGSRSGQDAKSEGGRTDGSRRAGERRGSAGPGGTSPLGLGGAGGGGISDSTPHPI